MRTRAMTLIELLLSLALLSSLAIACAAWMSTSTRLLTTRAPEARWLAAAERTLDALGFWIAIEDSGARPRPEPRWEALPEGDGCLIRTRVATLNREGSPQLVQAVVVRREADRLTSHFLSAEHELADRLLLAGMAHIEIGEAADSPGIFRVVLTSTGGTVAQRTWLIDREESRR